MPEARTARSRRTRAALVAAVRDELRRDGTFTAERVAAGAGCSVATYYVHLPSKDEALAQAFDLALAELTATARSIFEVERLTTAGLEAFTAAAVAELVGFFTTEAGVFRAALARLGEHARIRASYRAAEVDVLEHLRRFLTDAQTRGLVAGPDAAERAEALLVLAQAMNNPRLVRRPPSTALVTTLADALGRVVGGPDTVGP